MTHFKTILMTAALIAVPSATFAQISTGAVTDKVKDKAVDTVMDNMTTDDAVTAGTTMFKGGSREDAAMAVVKGRVNNKVEGVTDGVSMNDLSVDGAKDAGKAMAMEKAQGSASTYTNPTRSNHGLSTGTAMEAGKAMASDKAKGSSTSYSSPVIQKSKEMMPSTSAPTSTAAPVNCPAGTKDAGNGTCMITGDFKY